MTFQPAQSQQQRSTNYALWSSGQKDSATATKLWNSLPQTLKETNSLVTIRKNLSMIGLSSFLIGSAFNIS